LKRIQKEVLVEIATAVDAGEELREKIAS